MFNSRLISGALLAVYLCTITTQDTCPAGTPGLPGIPGLPGRDGRDGEKGEKGVSGLSKTLKEEKIKGEKGERGIQGPRGKQGKAGIQGPRGPIGKPGPEGEAGDNKPHSAFSVSRETTAYPAPNSPIIFQKVITNVNGHFNVTEGKFVCTFPGTYYFVYHATSHDVTLCVKLMVNEEKKATFCDHIQSSGNHYQVSSGGLAVYLQQDDKVWLETSDRLNGMYAAGDKGNSVFSGFLLYAH